MIPMEHAPPRFLEQPLRQAPIGPEPDQVDPIAVADSVPHRPAGHGVDVLDDRLLAEELEAIVDVGPADRQRLGLDRSRPSPARGRAGPTPAGGRASPGPPAATSSGRSRPASARGLRRSPGPPPATAGQIDARSSRFHEPRDTTAASRRSTWPGPAPPPWRRTGRCGSSSTSGAARPGRGRVGSGRSAATRPPAGRPVPAGPIPGPRTSGLPNGGGWYSTIMPVTPLETSKFATWR